MEQADALDGTYGRDIYTRRQEVSAISWVAKHWPHLDRIRWRKR